jgi:hypothetical protein
MSHAPNRKALGELCNLFIFFSGSPAASKNQGKKSGREKSGKKSENKKHPSGRSRTGAKG